MTNAEVLAVANAVVDEYHAFVQGSSIPCWTCHPVFHNVKKGKGKTVAA